MKKDDAFADGHDVTEEDADAISAIYAHHVLHGVASYDIEPPTEADTLAKIERVREAGWPFMVAEIDGEVVGYAYATQLRDRAGYRYTAEDSIYVHHDFVGRRIGKALLTELLRRAAANDFRTMIAVVGGAEPASVALHASLGFEIVGRLKSVGFKFGRWLDTVYMQRDLS